MTEKIIIVVLLVAFGALLRGFLLLSKKLTDQEKNKPSELKAAREAAVEKSRQVLKGHLTEQMLPLIGNLKGNYILSDWKFFGGNPIDYVIFNGLSEAKDNGGEFKEIVFVDVKSGNAKLSSHQKKIRDAVKKGKVRWATLHVDDEGNITESDE